MSQRLDLRPRSRTARKLRWLAAAAALLGTVGCGGGSHDSAPPASSPPPATAIDGVDVDDNTRAGIGVLNAGLFPPQAGETHTFTVEDVGGMPRTFAIQSAEVTRVPVQNTKIVSLPTGDVGYLLFNDHIATAEQALIDAVTVLQGVDDLVLDIGYNGGGYLLIASQLAYMIAGPATTAGRTFERLEFNAKHPTTDPVTGSPLEPIPFIDSTIGYSAPIRGEPLPTLSLPRVFVLTGSKAARASLAQRRRRATGASSSPPGSRTGFWSGRCERAARAAAQRSREPGPRTDRDLGSVTRFRLVRRDSSCVLVHEAGGFERVLRRARCEAAAAD
jgi:hypothetical protein